MQKYESEIKTISFGGSTITVENLTPILTQKESERRKREAETRLYEVFSKYTDQKNHEKCLQ